MLKIMFHRLSRYEILLVLSGVFSVIVLYSIAAYMASESSKTRFCILCHEMRVVAEQGWKRSSHFSNEQLVVAQCEDCHIPPELAAKIWTKTRDGAIDIAVHMFGESDPNNMHWEELGKKARNKISDSSCMKCHKNLTPKGVPIKVIVAHRAYLRMKDEKKCLECHRKSFHGKHREYISENTGTNGGVK